MPICLQEEPRMRTVSSTSPIDASFLEHAEYDKRALKSGVLSIQKIDEKSLAKLFIELEKNTSIKKIEIQEISGEMSEETLQALGKMLEGNTALIHIDLGEARIQEALQKKLLGSLFLNSNLRNIKIKFDNPEHISFVEDRNKQLAQDVAILFNEKLISQTSDEEIKIILNINIGLLIDKALSGDPSVSFQQLESQLEVARIQLNDLRPQPDEGEVSPDLINAIKQVEDLQQQIKNLATAFRQINLSLIDVPMGMTTTSKLILFMSALQDENILEYSEGLCNALGFMAFRADIMGIEDKHSSRLEDIRNMKVADIVKLAELYKKYKNAGLKIMNELPISDLITKAEIELRQLRKTKPEEKTKIESLERQIRELREKRSQEIEEKLQQQFKSDINSMHSAENIYFFIHSLVGTFNPGSDLNLTSHGEYVRQKDWLELLSVIPPDILPSRPGEASEQKREPFFAVEKIFETAFNYTKLELLDLFKNKLFSNTFLEGDYIRLGSTNHAMYLTIKNGKFCLFDPRRIEIKSNTPEEKEEALVEILEQRFFKNRKRNTDFMPIGISVFSKTDAEKKKIERPTPAKLINRILEQRKELNIDAKSWDGVTSLWMAARYGLSDIVQELAMQKADVNIKPPDDISPVELAIYFNDAKTLKILAQYGADVNRGNPTGLTPLHNAIRKSHTPCIKALIDLGADFTLQDQEGKKPLDDATPDINDLILEHILKDIDYDKEALKSGILQIRSIDEKKLKNLFLVLGNKTDIHSIKIENIHGEMSEGSCKAFEQMLERNPKLTTIDLGGAILPEEIQKEMLVMLVQNKSLRNIGIKFDLKITEMEYTSYFASRNQQLMQGSAFILKQELLPSLDPKMKGFFNDLEKLIDRALSGDPLMSFTQLDLALKDTAKKIQEFHDKHVQDASYEATISQITPILKLLEDYQHLLQRLSSYSDLSMNLVHMAAANGMMEYLPKLMDLGFPPNQKDEEDKVPMDYALAGNHTAVVKYLAQLSTSKAASESQMDAGCRQLYLVFGPKLEQKASPKTYTQYAECQTLIEDLKEFKLKLDKGPSAEEKLDKIISTFKTAPDLRKEEEKTFIGIYQHEQKRLANLIDSISHAAIGEKRILSTGFVGHEFGALIHKINDHQYVLEIADCNGFLAFSGREGEKVACLKSLTFDAEHLADVLTKLDQAKHLSEQDAVTLLDESLPGLTGSSYIENPHIFHSQLKEKPLGATENLKMIMLHEFISEFGAKDGLEMYKEYLPEEKAVVAKRTLASQHHLQAKREKRDQTSDAPSEEIQRQSQIRHDI